MVQTPYQTDRVSLYVGDCLAVLGQFPDDYFDLTFASPPYEDSRTYGVLNFTLSKKEWVQWAVPRFEVCLRVTKGLVAWVVAGKTENFKYSLVPERLKVVLDDLGYSLRVSPIYQRSGIAGSGGPDWLRNDYEQIICAQKKPGKLPWSDNTAMGHPPLYPVGGKCSNRKKNGERVSQEFSQPELANPGNVIKGKVGGGHMGSPYASKSEAPFPEWLPEFFIKSFSPPDGRVLDCFSGSGTTPCVAARLNRYGFGIDIREEQVQLALKRAEEVQPSLLD